MKFSILAGLLLMGVVPAAASVQNVNTGSPVEFAKALTNLGYKPSDLDRSGANPAFTVEISNWNTAVVFGGCNLGDNCKYVIFVSKFLDVKNPPQEWINKINSYVDMGKIWIGDDSTISFSLSIPMGGGEISVSSLRWILEQWTEIVRYLSSSAVSEKLVK